MVMSAEQSTVETVGHDRFPSGAQRDGVSAASSCALFMDKRPFKPR
jgi:hypothetical protein